MDEAVLRAEREKTDRLQKYLLTLISRAEKSISSHDSTVRILLADTWEELRLKPTALSPQDLEQLSIELDRFDARININNITAAHCRRLLNEPFFGRVDFTEDGEPSPEEIMIGLYNVKDDDGRILVHDWRAPVCSLYYDSDPGRASYECPAGEISGLVTLKRQYRMNAGILEYYVDTDISIDDTLLLDLLSGSADTHMKSIVSTIQKEQNRVIRFNDLPVLCVAGSAGSGKTSIALHRISYLLYKYRDTLTADQIRVISPSDTFNEYISRVLPDLGENTVNSCTMHAFVKSLLHTSVETPYAQNEDIMRSMNTVRTESVRYKSGNDFLTYLSDYCDKYSAEGPGFADLHIGDRIFCSEAELSDMFRREFAFLTPALRIRRIRSVLDRRLLLEKNRLTNEYNAKLCNKLRGHDLNTAVKVAVAQALQPLHEEISSMLRVDSADIYYNMPLPNGILSIRSGAIRWEDAPAIAYIGLRLGFIQPDNDTRQIIIDEAQDYSAVCLSVAHLCYPRAKATVLGDPYQRTMAGMPACDPTDWNRAFGSSTAPIQWLTKCYRSSKPITELLNRLLPDEAHIEPFGRGGASPVIAEYSIEALNSLIDEWRSEGIGSICIVTRTEHEASAIKRSIPDCIEAFDDEINLPGGMTAVIGSYHLFKGLEFDAVAVVWPDADTDDCEKRRIYTACSRALHRAALFTTADMIDRLGLSEK